MTFTDHIAAIRNLIAKGAASKDLKITDRLIGHFLNISRATVINKFPSISNWQTICMPLEESSISSVCADCTLPTSCETLMKSTVPVPNTVTNITNPVVVRTIDGASLGKGSIQNQKHSAYSLTQRENTKGWFIYNQYLYVFSEKNIPLVLVDGIFSSPEEVAILTPCTETSTDNNTTTPCNDSSTIYPVDAKAIAAIYESTLKFLSQAYRFGDDTTTDARDLAKQILSNKR